MLTTEHPSEVQGLLFRAICHHHLALQTMKKLLPILLIVAGLAFGYLGITTFQNSSANASFLGIDINASDEGGQMTGILYLVLGVIALIAGVGMYRKQ